MVPFCVLSRINLAYSPDTPALSLRVSEICGLFNSLCALFSAPILCFQQLADSFCKTPGVGVPLHDVGGCAGAQKCLSVSPLPATLTHSLSRKSFPCHSYANTRDGGVTAATNFERFQLPTRLPRAVRREGPFVYPERSSRRVTPFAQAGQFPPQASSVQPPDTPRLCGPILFAQPLVSSLKPPEPDAKMTACSHLRDTKLPQYGQSMSEPSVTRSQLRTANHKGEFYESRSENLFPAPRRQRFTVPHLASPRPGPLLDRSTLRIRIRAIRWRRRHGNGHPRHTGLRSAQERLQLRQSHRHRSGRGRRGRRRALFGAAPSRRSDRLRPPDR